MIQTRARSIRRRAVDLRRTWRRARARRRSDWPLPEGVDRIWHHHVRKTAGSSLNAAFWALSGLDWDARQAAIAAADRKPIVINRSRFVDGSTRKFWIAEGAYQFGDSHRSVERLKLPPRTFTVTILRDPLSRLVSYYRYLHHVGTEDLDDGPGPEELATAAGSFAEFLEHVPRKHREAQLYMFSNDLDPDAALVRLRRCDAVLFTETYDTDLASLSSRLGLPLQPQRQRSFAYRTKVESDERALGIPWLEAEYQFIDRVIAELRPDLAGLAGSSALH